MLKSVPMANITALPNYRQIDTDNGEFADLVSSVKKDGILQAALARPNAKKPGHYQLVFGNRRFLAAQKAGLKEFPVTVKVIADDDILEYQIMENLQRKDVHPMDEAAGFKAYQAKKKCDIKELAAVFAKTERYITHRLALNNLATELQSDFLKGFLNVSQVEIFAKLPADQQKDLRKQTWNVPNKRYLNATPAELKDKVERKFLLKLDAAPWKRDDETLVPAAGSCTNCKKRSSCHGLLFEGLVKDDRCLDATCYHTKARTFFELEVERIATTKPEIKFLKASWDEVDKNVEAIADKYGIPIISTQDTGVYSWKNSTCTPTKCFAISGHEMGKYVTVWISDKSKAAGSNSKKVSAAVLVKEQTAAIQARIVRSAELDYEKVQELIVADLRTNFPKEKPLTVAIDKETFDGLALYLLFKELSYMDRDMLKAIGMVEDSVNGHKNPDQLFTKLLQLDDIAKSSILKNALMQKCAGSKSLNTETFVLRKLAVYLGVPVHKFIDDQNQVAIKRETNANKRIEALQATAKPAAVKREKKKDINVGAEIIKKAGKILFPKKAAPKSAKLKNAKKVLDKAFPKKKAAKKSNTKSKKKAA